jgi:hypothetical protein
VKESVAVAPLAAETPDVPKQNEGLRAKISSRTRVQSEHPGDAESSMMVVSDA